MNTFKNTFPLGDSAGSAASSRKVDQTWLTQTTELHILTVRLKSPRVLLHFPLLAGLFFNWQFGEGFILLMHRMSIQTPDC